MVRVTRTLSSPLTSMHRSMGSNLLTLNNIGRMPARLSASIVTTESLPPPTGTSGSASGVPVVVGRRRARARLPGPTPSGVNASGKRVAVGELAEPACDEFAEVLLLEFASRKGDVDARWRGGLVVARRAGQREQSEQPVVGSAVAEGRCRSPPPRRRRRRRPIDAAQRVARSERRRRRSRSRRWSWPRTPSGRRSCSSHPRERTVRHRVDGVRACADGGDRMHLVARARSTTRARRRRDDAPTRRIGRDGTARPAAGSGSTSVRRCRLRRRRRRRSKTNAPRNGTRRAPIRRRRSRDPPASVEVGPLRPCSSCGQPSVANSDRSTGSAETRRRTRRCGRLRAGGGCTSEPVTTNCAEPSISTIVTLNEKIIGPARCEPHRRTPRSRPPTRRGPASRNRRTRRVSARYAQSASTSGEPGIHHGDVTVGLVPGCATTCVAASSG